MVDVQASAGDEQLLFDDRGVGGFGVGIIGGSVGIRIKEERQDGDGAIWQKIHAEDSILRNVEQKKKRTMI